MDLTDEQWKERLTEKQYRVLREKATERAFTGKYVDHHEDGMYHCAGCGAALFASESKFNSGSGWPSFDRAAASGAIELHEDTSFGMKRTEIRCSSCGGHLGHVFNDGPTQTGERFCVNSCSLDFKEK